MDFLLQMIAPLLLFKELRLVMNRCYTASVSINSQIESFCVDTSSSPNIQAKYFLALLTPNNLSFKMNMDLSFSEINLGDSAFSSNCSIAFNCFTT